MIKDIRIYALDVNINTVEDIKLLFCGCKLDNYFNFIWDDEHPEYIISTEIIYYDDKYARLFKKFHRDDTINIFWTGESISPDLNIFDYAVVFDRNLNDGDRVFRIPSIFRYKEPFTEKIPYTGLSTKELLDSKFRFCNFIYSNPKAHENRDKLFYKLCEYKQVDSLGSHLNNVGNQTSRNASDWRMKSIMDRIPYKFSIAAENVTFVGNITEKLISCFQAQTIPIYWGDPTVSEEFNEKAFINCHSYNNLDEVLKRVKEIDQNDELWCEIVSQPWQTDFQIKSDKIQLKKYQDFLINIFSQDVKDAKRTGIGSAPTIYREYFFNKRKDKLNAYYQVLVKWMRMRLDGIYISDILKNNNCYSVAVYGIGEIGKLLIDELVNSGISVEYGIDQSAVRYKNIPVVPMSGEERVSEYDSVDVIIVTIPSVFNDIKQNLQDKTSCSIISIEDLVNNSICKKTIL